MSGVQAPVAHFSRRYRFSASHRLHVEALTADANREMFGKCNNPFGHGHNYTLQVTFRGPVDPTMGMVTNLADLDAFTQGEVLPVFDVANLNSLPAFQDVVPSTENVCRELWRMFSEYPHARLERVRVEETENNSFDYFGDDVVVDENS